MSISSSRVARLGASMLLSLAMAVALGSTAFGASPTDPTPTPTVTPTPTPTATHSTQPATDRETRLRLEGCLPAMWGSSPMPPHCATLGVSSAGTKSAGARPSATTGDGDYYAVQGVVTGTGGTLLSDVEVDVESDTNGFDGWEQTAANGSFSVDVPAGTYRVSFYDAPDPYLNGYYSSGSSGAFSVDYSSATLVVVGSSNVTGIDVQLGTGYHIKGTVTALGGAPLEDIDVQTQYNDNYVDYAQTQSDGTYTLVVPAGTYRLGFTDWSGTYLNGYYSSGSSGHFSISYSSATPVVVGSADVTGMDVQLGTGYHIKGKVTASDGAPLGDIQVEPWSSSSDYSGSAMTMADGTYSVTVPAGTYTVQFSSYGICGDDGCTWPYLSGYYSSGGFVIDQSQATAVSVTSSDVTGINVVMAPAGSTYYPITPTRVLDTRNGTGALSGPFTNHAARTFQVTGGSSSIPDYATAVTGNLTVTGQTSSGYLFIGPVATNNPTSSTLNFPVGDDRANAVTVALSDSGTLSITFVAPSNGPTAQAIFDVTGYFDNYDDGATYHALTPSRALDTRSGTGGLFGPFTNHAARTFTLAGVPSGATAVTGNLTVTGQTSSGYLFIGPTANNNPTSSTLNFPLGDDRANAVTVALGTSRTLSITFVAPSNGPSAQAIFDVTGYFTDDMSGAWYVPLTPSRVLDTRNGTGGLSGPFGNHYARSFQVTGLAGVPSYATAVTGNLTVTGQTSGGYLYIGPSEKNDPTSSNLNFPLGDDRANAVAVALGTDGTLSITFVGPSNGQSAQAIFDVTGYFVPSGTVGGG